MVAPSPRRWPGIPAWRKPRSRSAMPGGSSAAAAASIGLQSTKILASRISWPGSHPLKAKAHSSDGSRTDPSPAAVGSDLRPDLEEWNADDADLTGFHG